MFSVVFGVHVGDIEFWIASRVGWIGSGSICDHGIGVGSLFVVFGDDMGDIELSITLGVGIAISTLSNFVCCQDIVP